VNKVMKVEQRDKAVEMEDMKELANPVRRLKVEIHPRDSKKQDKKSKKICGSITVCSFSTRLTLYSITNSILSSDLVTSRLRYPAACDCRVGRRATSALVERRYTK
jgi:hypothetical protein